MKSIGLTWAVVLIAAASAVAKPDKPKKPAEVVKEVVKEIKTGLTKGDAAAVTAAFARAEKLSGDFTAKKFGPVVKAIGAGVAHKDKAIAVAAIETLGRLKATGSGKLLGKLVAPPAKVADDRLDLHKAAIAAAGSIHDPASLKPLEKLLSHANEDMAVAGAEALTGYRALDPKPRMTLVNRLVKVLAGLEKKAKAKDEKVKARATAVRGALITTISKITGIEGPASAADWTKRLKEEAKKG